jgi:hypothetical protein
MARYRRNGTKGVEAIMRGQEYDEFQIGGSNEVWTIYISSDPATGRPYTEIKASPHALDPYPDWDWDAYWFDRTRQEVHEELEGRRVKKLTED